MVCLVLYLVYKVPDIPNIMHISAYVYAFWQLICEFHIDHNTVVGFRTTISSNVVSGPNKNVNRGVYMAYVSKIETVFTKINRTIIVSN